MPRSPSAVSTRSPRSPVPETASRPASVGGMSIRQHTDDGESIVRSHSGKRAREHAQADVSLKARRAGRLPALNFAGIGGIRPANESAVDGASDRRIAPSLPENVARALARVVSDDAPGSLRLVDRHLRFAQRHIDDACQPGAAMLLADMPAIAQAIDVENARKPGLNLQLCHCMRNLLERMCSVEPASRARFIFRVPDICRHFMFAELCRMPDRGVSIILIESADLTHPNLYRLYARLTLEIKACAALAGARLMLVDGRVQHSPSDCLIFAMSFALKAYRHDRLFLEWHDRRDEQALRQPPRAGQHSRTVCVDRRLPLPVFAASRGLH